jgi:hypothetical protein
VLVTTGNVTVRVLDTRRTTVVCPAVSRATLSVDVPVARGAAVLAGPLAASVGAPDTALGTGGLTLSFGTARTGKFATGTETCGSATDEAAGCSSPRIAAAAPPKYGSASAVSAITPNQNRR